MGPSHSLIDRTCAASVLVDEPSCALGVLGREKTKTLISACSDCSRLAVVLVWQRQRVAKCELKCENG